MKRYYLFICISILAGLFSNRIMAQPPNKFSYQAVIRDANDVLLVNTTVGIKVSILQDLGMMGIVPVYIETHTATTNNNGLLSIQIGNGTPISGTISSISWSVWSYALKTEIDPAGGSNYSIIGTAPLLSVPYAMYANSSGDNKWTSTGPNHIANTNSGNVGINIGIPPNKLSVVGNSSIIGNVGIGTHFPTEQLHTTGAVRHQSLSGIGTRAVYANAEGKLEVPLNSTATNSTVQNGPAGNCQIVTSTITLSGLPTSIPSQNISVNLNVSCYSASWIKAFIVAPNGDILNLTSNGQTGGFNNCIQNITFTDFGFGKMTPWNTTYFNYVNSNAVTDISPQPEGEMTTWCSITPTVATFGAIAGGNINPNGIWTLKILQDYPSSSWSLNSWSVNAPLIATGVNGTFPKWNNNFLSTNSNISEVNDKIAIGMPFPSHKLTVNGDIRAFGASVLASNALKVQNSDLSYSFGLEKDNINGGRLSIAGNWNMLFATNGIDRMVINNGGAVGIATTSPTATLSVNGSANKPGGGSWAVFSDQRLKQNILPYQDGLATLTKISPVRFHYNEKAGCDTKPEYIGVLAQELQKVAPYMVSKFLIDEVEYLSVDNSAMTYMLINSVKEQQTQIELLKKENEILRQRMDAIEK
ncbi:MAG: tail fiber domain-containing protein [Chitinophagaceae bacterium]|nr:tail fiber domain-containing protein [Chitinophagaceae bacterium]